MKILVDNNIVDVSTIVAITDVRYTRDYEIVVDDYLYTYVFMFDIILDGKNKITITKEFTFNSTEISNIQQNINLIEDYNKFKNNEEHRCHITYDDFCSNIANNRWTTDLKKLETETKNMDSIKDLLDGKLTIKTDCIYYNNFNKLRFELVKLWNDNKIDLPTFNLEDY